MGNNSQVVIRKAKAKDAGSIAMLHKKVVCDVNSKFYSPEAIEEWIRDISEKNVINQFQTSDWIVVEMNGKLIGFGQYSATGKEIYQINVEPNYLGQSIGRKLCKYIESYFTFSGIEKIGLYSTLNAVGFYRKLGFEVVREIYIGSIKMIEMEKYLRL